MTPEVADLLARLDEAHAASTPIPSNPAALATIVDAYPALAAELRRQDAALKVQRQVLADLFEAVARGDEVGMPEAYRAARAALAAGDDGQATT